MGFHKVTDFRKGEVNMEVEDLPDGVYINLYGPRGGARDTAVMTVKQTETLIDDLKEQLRRVEGRKLFLGGECDCVDCMSKKEDA